MTTDRYLVLGFTALMCTASAGAYPGEDRVLSSKALEAYKAGHFEQAQELYRQAAEKASENAPEATYNAGASAYKAGKVEEAEQTFRSVYDQENRLLNAATGYNLGVIDQRRAQPVVEKARKAPPLSELPQEQLEPLKKEIGDAIKLLEKALRNYRDAITRAPGDREMKVNFELALRDLEFLKKKLEELEPPQQDQQQNQQQQQQDQQQKSQDQQKKDDQKKQDQQQQQQDQQQKDQQQQQQEQQQQEQKPEQQQSQNKDQQGPGQQQKDEQQEGSADQQQKENEQKGEEGKPQDDSRQPDKQEGKPSDQQKDGQKGQSGDQSGSGQEDASGEPLPGEMSERDVERLLNALPSENTNALQRMLNVRTRESDMEKDW